VYQLNDLARAYSKFDGAIQYVQGMYVMVIGDVSYGEDGKLQLTAAKASDLSNDSDSFAMWLCEVIDVQLELARNNASASSAVEL
jgi:hypothetical protein